MNRVYGIMEQKNIYLRNKKVYEAEMRDICFRENPSLLLNEIFSDVLKSRFIFEKVAQANDYLTTVKLFIVYTGAIINLKMIEQD